MMIGDANLLMLDYEFYRSSFSSVYFQSASSSIEALVAAFIVQFGDCYDKPSRYEETYLWYRGTIGQVYLNCTHVDYHCEGIIHSKAADKQKEADKAAGATRAKRDF
jgi:hypothetical protein